MSDTDLKKLFNDFCTLKSNAHLNPNGVGLGLSICKKICNNLGGDITVISTLGKGSVFTYYMNCDIIDETSQAMKIESDSASVSKMSSV